MASRRNPKPYINRPIEVHRKIRREYYRAYRQTLAGKLCDKRYRRRERLRKYGICVSRLVVAEMLGVTSKDISSWIKLGILPKYTVGGSVGYRPYEAAVFCYAYDAAVSELGEIDYKLFGSIINEFLEGYSYVD